MARDYVTGDKELAKALRAMARGPSAREIDGMATRSSDGLVSDVRARLRAHRNFPSKYSSFFPKQRGKFSDHLDKTIVFRKDAVRGKERSYRIGATRRGRRLLHLVEFGTASHWQGNLGGGFMHPGASPSPTITPAYEAGHAAVIREFGFEMADWLQRAGSAQGLKIVRRTRSS